MNAQTFNLGVRIDEILELDIGFYAKRRLVLQACKEAGLVFIPKEAIAGLDLEHPEYYENQKFIVIPEKYYNPIDLEEAQHERSN